LTDKIILVCTLLLAAVYFYATAQIPTLEIGDPLGPKAFPRLLGIGLLITAAILFLEIRAKAKERRDETPQAAAGDYKHLWVIAGVTVWTGLYYAVFESLGYVLGSAAYLLGLTGYFHRGKWVTNILVSVLFAIGTYLVFVKVFGVMLAEGVLKI
jgi:putative tricarboxylic transport membrane protein